MPKRSPAKPIDWNADVLSRKRAAAPVPTASVQPAAPAGDPAWKQLLDNAVKDAPHPEEATRVFEPVAPAQPVQPVAPTQPVQPAPAVEEDDNSYFDDILGLLNNRGNN